MSHLRRRITTIAAASLRRIAADASPDYPDPHPFHWHYSEFEDSNFQIRGRTLFFIVVLFAIVLLITFLFLYARWVCRFGPRPGGASTHAPPLAAPPPAPARGLDPSRIEGIPITLHRKLSESTQSECCICLGIFQEGDKVKNLPQCNHCFHSECVDKWLRTQSSCPLCRTSLRFDSPV